MSFFVHITFYFYLSFTQCPSTLETGCPWKQGCGEKQHTKQNSLFFQSVWAASSRACNRAVKLLMWAFLIWNFKLLENTWPLDHCLFELFFFFTSRRPTSWSWKQVVKQWKLQATRSTLSNLFFPSPALYFVFIHVTDVYVLYFRPFPSWTFTFITFENSAQSADGLHCKFSTGLQDPPALTALKLL